MYCTYARTHTRATQPQTTWNSSKWVDGDARETQQIHNGCGLWGGKSIEESIITTQFMNNTFSMWYNESNYIMF